MDLRARNEAWKSEIMEAIDDMLDLDKLGGEDNLTGLSLFRLMEIFYREQGDEGFTHISRIWEYIAEQYKTEKS